MGGVIGSPELARVALPEVICTTWPWPTAQCVRTTERDTACLQPEAHLGAQNLQKHGTQSGLSIPHAVAEAAPPVLGPRPCSNTTVPLEPPGPPGAPKTLVM